MNRNQKIVVIGAGSADFAIASFSGLLRHEGLRGSELALVDIDAEKLAIVEKAVGRMNREWGAEMTISATTERKEALENAGFVILSVAVDREATWKRDHELGLKYGISHYAENGGPAAFAHASRNLALILPIVQDIEAICPDAFFFNFTNPLTRISNAVEKLTHLQHVGMCHGIGNAYFVLATAMHEELGIELRDDPRFLWCDEHDAFCHEYQCIARKRYNIRASGINHFTWIQSIWDKETGQDVLPLVEAKMAELPAIFEPLTQKMFQLYGLIPVNGDTHITEYVPFTSDVREGTWERFDIQLYDFEWSNNRRLERIRFLNEIANGQHDLTPLKDDSQSERVEFMIDAMLHNQPRYEEAVNIPNRGYIPNLPDGVIVEVPGMVDASGISGVHVGPLPEPLAAICRLQLTIDDLNLEAYLNGDRQLVRQMFSIDPMIQDPDIAIKLADETIDMNLDYLPTFRE